MLTLDWFWFWQKPEIDFVTPLSVDECRSRLKRTFEAVSEKSFVGEVQGDKFYLAKKTPGVRDDFRPCLYGTLVLTPHGTRIQAAFRLHAVITLIIVLWLLFFLCASFGNALLGKEPLSALMTLTFFWIIVLGVFTLFGWLGSWSNKSNREILADYLHKILLPSQE
jgi:hypothetical protein